MPGNKYLILRLKGPMQSWGLRAKFDNRSTEMMPTKSGVIGLLAAGLGLDRSNAAGIASLCTLKLMTICVKEGKVLTDYHTVGAGYDKTDHPEKTPLTAKGTPMKDPIVTHRQYLCDYEFLAVLYGNSKLIDRCSSAVRDSVYPLYLGRKSCMPSTPLRVGICQNKQELKTCLTANKWQENQRVSCEVDDEGQFEQDVPVNFKTRKFSSRRISGDIITWLK